MGYISLNFYPKNTPNLDQQVNQQQNTVCLKQQIYASPVNFTPTLLVTLETFRRSESGAALQTALSLIK